MKSKIIVIFLTIFLILFLAVSVQATIYYVTSSGAGSQTGADMSNAWSWSDFVAGGAGGNSWGAGDVVCLSGSFSLGTSDYDIQSGGSGGTWATIDGSGSGVCSNASAATVSGSYSAGNATMHFDGRSYVLIKNLTVSGTQETGIKIENGDNFEIDSITIDAGHTYGVVANDVDYIEVHDSTISRSSYAQSGDGIYMRGVTYSSIHNNEFENWGHEATSIDSTTADGQSAYIDVYFNYAFFPDYPSDNSPYGRFIGINGEGSSDPAYIWVHHNYTYGLRSNIMQIDNTNHLYFYRNIFSHTTNSCLEEDSLTNPYDLQAGCSVLYTTGNHPDKQTGSDFAIYGNANGPNSYIYIYNNTAYISYERMIHFVSAGHDNIHFENNILDEGGYLDTNTVEANGPIGSENTSIDGAIIGRLASHSAPTNFTFQYNVVYATQETDLFSWGSSLMTLAQFEAAESGASNNFNVNPQMTDPDNEDFTINP